MSNEIDYTGMDEQTAALVRQYAGTGTSQTQEPEQFTLSSNGHQRVKEAFQQRGMTRAEAQADAGMNKTALLRALAEQSNNRGGVPHGEGVGGRSLSNSTKGTRVGKSLAQMAQDSEE